MSSGSDHVFGASVAEIYERDLVPLIFEPYATEVARRLPDRGLSQILEIAAGTGVLTRALATALPARVEIIASDLNQAMLDRAMAIGTSRPVEWRQADAMALPFADDVFDAVVCQFGVMFFPDKPAAFAETRRVLRPGGTFLFTVWDRIEENEFADSVTSTVASFFPDDPPSFLRRTPHGYFDINTIKRHLVSGGFANAPDIETLTERSTADSSMTPAVAYCQGTPLRNEIEARDASLLKQVTDVAAEALARRFGNGPIDGKVQAHLISVTA